jgi:hypothetical protein
MSTARTPYTYKAKGPGYGCLLDACTLCLSPTLRGNYLELSTALESNRGYDKLRAGYSEFWNDGKMGNVFDVYLRAMMCTWADPEWKMPTREAVAATLAFGSVWARTDGATKEATQHVGHVVSLCAVVPSVVDVAESGTRADRGFADTEFA